MDVDAEIHERFRHVVACAHDISDIQPRSDFHVNTGCAIGGRSIEIVRTQTGITYRVIALLVIVTFIGGNGRNCVRLLLEPGRRDVEVKGLIVSVFRSRELFLPGLPAIRQVEFYRSFRRTFDIAVNVDRHLKRLCVQRNNSRLRSDGDGNGRACDQRFEHRSRTRYPLHRLNYLRQFEWRPVEYEMHSGG